jgi:hypothetical protein
VLGRAFDPDRKIELLVGAQSNEARSRNRVMDLVAPRGGAGDVAAQGAYDIAPEPPDYFLVVDPDEVWTGEDLERLRAFVARDRLPCYRAGAHRYFKRWRYRIEGLEWSTVAIRADVRFHDLRNIRYPLWRRTGSRVPVLPSSLRQRIRRCADVPADVAVFHHGSYVGPRDRIAAKLRSFGHAHQVQPGWMEEVWDLWTPEMRDLNPAWPELYPAARRIDIDELPPAVRAHRWPPEFLDDGAGSEQT